jgi:hypothetical protein
MTTQLGSGGRRLIVGLCLVATIGVASAETAAASTLCDPVVNPYKGTRYEGVDLRRIRASGVSCAKARRVARGAHGKALGLSVPEDGIRTFTWKGWRVRGDVRGRTDRYVAKAGDARVSWVF